MLKLRATPTQLGDGPFSFRFSSGSDWGSGRKWAGLLAAIVELANRQRASPLRPECSCKNVHIASAITTISLASFSKENSLLAPVSIVVINDYVTLVSWTYFVVVFCCICYGSFPPERQVSG